MRIGLPRSTAIGMVFLVLASAVGSARGEGLAVTIPLIADGKPDPADSSVPGYLFAPDGTGPFGAVVLLHGCDGLLWRGPRQTAWRFLTDYARRFVRLGYVAVVLDSFKPRGVDEACGRPMTVSPARRAWDALSAVRFLVGLGTVDPARIVVEGHSHGAVAVLIALETGRWQVPERFAAGIAWYPGCTWNRTGLTAPLLILIGGADDWTKASECRALVKRLAAAGQEDLVALHVYPGATHAFDAPGEPHYVVGHQIRYDPAAAADGWAQIEAFLRDRVPAAGAPSR